MRLRTFMKSLMPLAVSAVLATGVLAQEHVNINPNAVRGQLDQGASSGSGSAPQQSQGPSQAEVKMPKKPAPKAAAQAAPAKPAAQATAKAPAAPANQAAAKAQAAAPVKPAAPAKAASAAAKAPATKTPAAPAMKSAANAPAKAPEKPAEKAEKPKAPATAAEPAATTAEKASEEKPVVRRDPFDTLLTKARASNAPPANLPPGKAGLLVESLRIDGIVHSPNGMIAIVSNAQQRVYFLRDGDKLYDGSVDKIALDSIAFHEVGKDAFGKPLERTVTKQLYASSSGEQQ